MKRIMKFVVATSSAIIISTTSAFAFQVWDGWRGLSVGVSGTWAKFETSGYEQEQGGGGAAAAAQDEKTTATEKENVAYGAIFAEISGGGDHWGVTVGVEHIPFDAEIGSKTRTDGNNAADTSDDGTYTGKAEVSDHTTIYIEPTVMISDAFGLYLKGGLSTVQVNTLESIAIGTDSSAYGDERTYGIMGGLGLRAFHSSGAFLKVEWLKTAYDTVTMESTSGNKHTVSGDIDNSQTRIAVGYNF